MTDRTAFEPDQWQRLRSAPWVVALGVIAADTSGPLDTGRELAALEELVTDTDAHGSRNDLIRAVANDLVADRSGEEGRGVGELEGYDSLGQGALAHCRAVVEILDGVAEEAEAAEFRAWLLSLGHGVAAAAKEGGFLGFGGEVVSADEQDMLQALAEALQVEA